MHDFSLRSITSPEFDYNFLMSLLQPYRQPWSKIRQMLRQKEIIRVKKGIYVKNPAEGSLYSEGILANMIYGPSYVSGEYALSWHGLIPEKVLQITSVTTKPSKAFVTPVGSFTYKHLSRERYASGFIRIDIDDQRAFLIATAEKAIVDTIADKDISSPDDLHRYLVADLRIEEENLRKLHRVRLLDLKRRFRRPIVDALVELNQRFNHE